MSSNGEHVSRRELALELRALEYRLRLIILAATLANVAAAVGFRVLP